MGQTLTHGIYLPDEGERNCYNGLAANWSILDGAVGTIAEHTTALAGKAPLVHTHTVSDITDFPAYGNTAGTICEGNDSRLSDARTPVAHTHTKSDVTDLFNSANTWTALNSYNQSIQITANFNIGAAPSSDVYGGFHFGNGTSNIGNVTARVSSAGITYSRLYVSNKYANGVLDPNGTLANVELQVGLKANGNRFIYSNASWDNSLVPYANNTYDLGSSSYQWNNLYAKNYYYNGVTWGLDKQNTWTNFQRMTSNPAVWYLRNNTVTLGTAPASNRYIGMFFEDVNGADLGYATFQANKNSYNSIIFNVKNYDGTNTYVGGLRFRVSTTGDYSFFPEDSECDLGISTNKWKTLNGINPGALSLPDLSDSDPIDTQNWVGDNSTGNAYTPTENGWVYLRITGTNKTITIRYGGSDPSSPTQTNESTITHLSVFFPVIAGVTMRIFYKDTIEQAFFYPCLGNV